MQSWKRQVQILGERGLGLYSVHDDVGGTVLAAGMNPGKEPRF